MDFLSVEFGVGLLTGTFIGAAGAYFGDKYTDIRRKKEAAREQRDAFVKCEKTMPKLFAEMRANLKSHPLARKFVLIHGMYAGSNDEAVFVYRFDEHADLKGKVDMLESSGFVENITLARTARYRMTETFAELLAQ